MRYSERVTEPSTQRSAKSISGAAGSAGRQADAAVESKTVFGFWVYLMTDAVLFASLFATFAVLRNNVYNGPSGQEIFSLPFVLTETPILLTSSFSVGLAWLAARQGNKRLVLVWLGVTYLLGLAFLILELREFSHLYQEGNSWRRSAFLSSFFTLVGTHGTHITAGLVWMSVLGLRIYKVGLFKSSLKKITMLSLFWHFLDVIWIFIFTIVYLMGVIG
ncbi:cytochrome o ubiquinol oxidase subunit III [Candidatus Saccharibacteria bacterium]|nr:cytochrome o ubiquinol oxidase subunit III [Candidatus Saccharibacteria bacterium]